MTQKSFVSVMRCPDGYCCQSNDICKEIDSCNTGRVGTLCGRCEQNLTESLFTPKCLPTESCKLGLFLIILISAVIIYAVASLFLNSMKDFLIKFFKKVYKTWKISFQNDTEKQKYTKEQKSNEDTVTNDNGFKYMQLLFYYVQDSKLFTVQLPEISAKTDNIVVNFLEFSPWILEAYIQARDLCFEYSSSVLKVTLQLLFGFLVMIFLFLVYALHRILSHYLFRKLDSEEMRKKLVQAFLLTVLFSYQKVVIGVFTLVQCVEVKNQTILFLQGDILCYTW